LKTGLGKSNTANYLDVKNAVGEGGGVGGIRKGVGTNRGNKNQMQSVGGSMMGLSEPGAALWERERKKGKSAGGQI